MSRRLLELIAVMTMIVAVAALLKLAPVPARGQAPTAAGEAGESPDLQGIWTTEYETPLQRPARFADKEFFTEEERAVLDGERAAILDRDPRPSQGSPLGTGGAYNRAIFLSNKPTGPRTSLIVEPRDGKVPPFAAEAQQRRSAIREYQLALLRATDVCKNKLPDCAGGQYGPPSPRRAETPPHYLTSLVNRADGPEDRSLGERCMSGQLPDFGGAAGFFLQIVQSPGAVSIFYDTGQGQAWQRIVPVTDRPHLPSHVRQWWGDSRGRWEGNTLVVDVTNFTPKTDFQGSRENLHLVERWTRIDADTIRYVSTMDDPTTWTSPWTVALELKRQSNQANRIYKEPRCHEGNYGMPGLLRGARAEERAFAEGRGPDPATFCTADCGSAFVGENRDPLR